MRCALGTAKGHVSLQAIKLTGTADQAIVRRTSTFTRPAHTVPCAIVLSCFYHKCRTETTRSQHVGDTCESAASAMHGLLHPSKSLYQRQLPRCTCRYERTCVHIRCSRGHRMEQKVVNVLARNDTPKRLALCLLHVLSNVFVSTKLSCHSCLVGCPCSFTPLESHLTWCRIGCVWGQRLFFQTGIATSGVKARQTRTGGAAELGGRLQATTRPSPHFSWASFQLEWCCCNRELTSS